MGLRKAFSRAPRASVSGLPQALGLVQWYGLSWSEGGLKVELSRPPAHSLGASGWGEG